MKSIVSMSIDYEVIVEARNRQINISKMCNNFLRDYLNMPKTDLPKDKEKLQTKLNEARGKVLEIQQELDKFPKQKIFTGSVLNN